MKKLITSVIFGTAMASAVAFADTPIPLSEHQLDSVTGGLSTVTIIQAGASIGVASTSGSSLVVGVSLGGLDAAFGAGATGGASVAAGSWTTTNSVTAN